MKKYRTVFLGTPEFSVPILRRLAASTEVVLVVSQPDRRVGRGCKLCKPPVKLAAEALGIDVIQPAVVKGKRFAAKIAALAPDFIVTAAFGRILGPSLLKVPTRKALNVHASLLPKYRGAAPANWAILNGDVETGICIMEMVPELDAGPVFLRRRTPIEPTETAGELLARLSTLGAETLAECLSRFDELRPESQEHSKASYARMLRKDDGLINWSLSAETVVNHIRGMSPWPSAFSCIEGAPYKIHHAQQLDIDIPTDVETAPGTIIAASKHGVDVVCGRGVLRITEIQAPGRKRMPIQAFFVGTPLASGTRLCRR